MSKYIRHRLQVHVLLSEPILGQWLEGGDRRMMLRQTLLRGKAVCERTAFHLEGRRQVRLDFEINGLTIGLRCSQVRRHCLLEMDCVHTLFIGHNDNY